MNSLQEQMITLSNKLDSLYQVIEQLDTKVSQALSRCSDETIQGDRKNFLETSETDGYNLQGHISFNSEMEHKDVLVEAMYPDTHLQAGDKQLTPEIQIQRLTAQLTAAYNRIAALEEQLLLKRIHS
ncbi:MAG: hypothetical protein QNJ47_06095 [Nostocaceae cyanobacterium]|nr:hypothetical protein [Nostocaceae cyanobacterium]